MPENHPFTVARMRRSLYAFLAGKAVSAIVGVGWLLLLVRSLDVSDYAGYVVLVAVMEIVLLTSNAGVFPFAQRYLPEARLPAGLPFLPAIIWRSIAYRLLTLTAAAVLLITFADFVSAAIGQSSLAPLLPIYGCVVIFEGAARYVELVFESLLEQGRAQLCALARNAARLCWGLVVWIHVGKIDLAEVLKIELTMSAIGFALCALLLAHWVAKNCRVSPEASAFPFSRSRVVQFAAPLFAAQCIAQLYSPDAVKLLVSRLLGVGEAAVFGFAHALGIVIQRYAPANLLSGLIRPMLVAHRLRANSDEDLVAVANLIIKVNTALLLPAAALFAVAGSEIATLISGGKYPSAGHLLCILTLLAVFNGVHVVLGMIANAIEDRRAVLVATSVSVLGLAIGIELSEQFGSFAMVAGLIVSECLWCATTLQLLGQRYFRFHFDLLGAAKLFVAATIAGAIASVLLYSSSMTGIPRISTALAVIAVVFVALVFALRPFSLGERERLRRLIPSRSRS